MEEIIIRGARKDEAPLVATMIMEAMNHECCQNFAGNEHTLDDFHRMMTALVVWSGRNIVIRTRL